RTESVKHVVSSKKRVILSGIQPTGIPHLGNYLGALINWVQLQNDAGPEDELLFSIVGWHAMTLPQKPKELVESRMDMLAVLLAIGIDSKKSIVFHQNDVLQHTELAWVLNCITPIGKLEIFSIYEQTSRLAASKNLTEDAEMDETGLNVGLFTYPVLMSSNLI
ncbi:Nucleotidylyl transferase, partial [Dendrothele bispora CBS 962.96]